MMQSNFRAYSCTLMLIVAMYALPHYLFSVILMDICLCNFTLIHYFNFDTLFGAGVHQFVMISLLPVVVAYESLVWSELVIWTFHFWSAII